MRDSARQDPSGASGQVEASGLARRQFLMKAAVVGTVAWAVPTMITVEPAGAAGLTSPPPDVGPPGVEGTSVEANVGVADAGGIGAEQLAYTGAEPDDLLRAGLAATAGGAALVYWNARNAANAAKAEIPPDPPGR